MADEANDGKWDVIECFKEEKNWIFYSATIGCPIAIFVGVFTNIIAFVVLVRGRLWRKHEGYVYLAANFCANVGVLLFCTSSFWLRYETGHYHPPTTSNFVCKMWNFLMRIFYASGWLSFAIMTDVYRRERLIQRGRNGPAKYCTLFASKIIVGVIFSVLIVLGIPYLVIFNLDHEGSCLPSDDNVLGIAPLIMDSIVMWFIPFFALLIILLMMLCAKREGNLAGFSQIEERSVSDEQMQVMAVTLSAMTLFSQVVLVFIRLLFSPQMGPIAFIGLTISVSLDLQPILCFVILKTLFREEFLSQLRDIRCCRRLFPSLIRYDEVVQMSAIQEDPPNTTVS